MSKGIFIIGTDTNVGKTIVSAGIMHLLRQGGYNAGYFKPILSGAIIKEGKLIPLDTSFVKYVSNIDESIDNMTIYKYRLPVSPHLAARKENNSINQDEIMKKLEELRSRYEYIVVEGCGGVIVPLNDDGLMLYHLIKRIGYSCILVARASLGTINHTLLTTSFANSIGIDIKGIIINQYAGNYLEDENIKIIEKHTALPILGTIPRIQGIDEENFKEGILKKVFNTCIDVDSFVERVMG